VSFGCIEAARSEQEGAEINSHARVVRWSVFRIEEVPFGTVLTSMSGEGHSARSAHCEADAAEFDSDLRVCTDRFGFCFKQGRTEGGGNVGHDRELEAIEAGMKDLCVHLC
jgi:hypothetical protein